MTRLAGWIGLAAVLATGSAAAQTCAWMPKPVAESAIPYLPEGAEVQYYCQPCKDRRAVKSTVQETEIRPLDTYNHQLLINDQPTDLAYLYIFDPGRRRWANLGLLIRCHEEDDVPPTLPANRAAP